MDKRGRQVTRQWRLLVLLRRRRLTLAEIARELEVTERTIRRDLDVLSAVPFPIRRTARETYGEAALDVFWLGPMPNWPRNEPMPTGELSV